MSVNWASVKEQTQAIALLKEWAEIGLEQALPMLSGFFSLNEVYSHMRIASLTSDDDKIINRFKEIRNFAV